MRVIRENNETCMELAVTYRGVEGAAPAGSPNLVRVRIDEPAIRFLEKALVRYSQAQAATTQGVHPIGSAQLDPQEFPIAYFEADRPLDVAWSERHAQSISLFPRAMVFWATACGPEVASFESERVGYEHLIVAIRNWRAEQTRDLLAGAMHVEEGAVPAKASSGLSPL